VTVEVRVVDDPTRAATDILVTAAGHVALSGGSAASAYELAAEIRPDWSGIHVWFGDDRAVPPDDELSNYRLAKETLLDRLSVQPEVHRIHGELGAKQAADLYDAELEGITLDLALNGIGPDGHTASLYPSAPALDEKGGVRSLQRPGGALRSARDDDACLRCGQARLSRKRREQGRVIRLAFAGEPSPEIPASLIRGRKTIALLDRGAASQLPQG
jgi:6-phosphogluconolactonase/glucosamine-6-phosphate isomerase/deaminase